LFVDKDASEITYTNESDYTIDCLLSLPDNQGLWSNGQQTVVNPSNVEQTNLLKEEENRRRPSEFENDYKNSFYN
jgi:hypothetical protein